LKGEQIKTEEAILMKNKNLEETQEKLYNLNKNLDEKVRKRTNEVNKLLTQKDNFINQLGHDLKNPLTPLVNLLPMIERTETDPTSKETLRVLHRNVDRIKRIVVQTLELAELNKQDHYINFENINLHDEVENSIKDQKIVYNEKEIKLENNIGKNIVVNAGKTQLNEVLINIINNAVKYSPVKSKIIFDAHDDGEFVTISVKDSGIGMTKDQIEHIFDEFYKVDESRHDFDSCGLGLSICKSIIEKHGGKIWVESPGLRKGSTFYFTVPSSIELEHVKIQGI
jgi:signal transduction histidine kinase